MDAWNTIVGRKITDLELIASWASMVRYQDASDHIKIAIYDLKQHLKAENEQNRPEK